MRGQPLPCQALGFLDLRGRKMACDEVAVFDTIFIALRCRQISPHLRLDIVLRDAIATVVHKPKAELGPSITLLSEWLPFTKRGLKITTLSSFQAILKVHPSWHGTRDQQNSSDDAFRNELPGWQSSGAVGQGCRTPSRAVLRAFHTQRGHICFQHNQDGAKTHAAR